MHSRFVQAFVPIFFLFMMTVGCSNNETNHNNGVTEEAKEDRTKEMYPFPNNIDEKGVSNIILSTPTDTSENGKVPILYISADNMIVQIGIEAQNFDSNKQSFVYVDKVYSSKEHFGEQTQTSVDLEEEMLKPGIHTVSVVQFDNDDPKDGSVTTYAEAKYEIKDKK